MLRRYVNGEQKVWHVVHIPSDQDEERRYPYRELWSLKRNRTRVINRITSLQATVRTYVKIDTKLPARLDGWRQWNGEPLPAQLRARVVREWETVVLGTPQIQAL